MNLWDIKKENLKNSHFIFNIDILIVGGGITGLLCAYNLFDKYKITIIDKDKISTKNEEVLIDTLEYSSKEIKKLKKNKLLVILLTILITIILIILIDTLQAIIFKNSPIISWRVADKNDSDSYIDKGILINT